MDLYAQNVLDRYKEPFYKGKLSDATLKHEEANHSCGDKVECRLNMKNGKISGYGFEGAGCAISMAAADMLGDRALGLTPDEALSIAKQDVYEMLGIEISLRRSKCALLALLALQNALLLRQQKEGRAWTFYHLE